MLNSETSPKPLQEGLGEVSMSGYCTSESDKSFNGIYA